MNTQPETILNATLATEQTEQTETMSATVVSEHYKSILDTMSTIHNDIAAKVNAKREATRISFFRPEDDYIPETNTNDFHSLMLSVQ